MYIYTHTYIYHIYFYVNYILYVYLYELVLHCKIYGCAIGLHIVGATLFISFLNDLFHTILKNHPLTIFQVTACTLFSCSKDKA